MTATPNGAAISLVELGKDYGATVAVQSVTLEIPAGRLFFLLGPSGCGKTTLLRMIAGFIEPTRGRILFGSRDVTGVPPNKRSAGMVFQSYALWPHLSVFDNVAFGLDVRRVSAAEKRRRVEEALERVQMQAYATRKPNELSGGQQQRVALARALVIEPTVLLLDEPLSNLDAKLRLEMRGEIRRLCTELGITTVYVTHDQKEALSMADDVAVLRHGRVMQRGAPHELYQRPCSRFVADFLGETNFLAGRIRRREGDSAEVETCAGVLRSTCLPPAGADVGDSVTVSIRPEAFVLAAAPGPNILSGRRTGVVYLGDTAQHLVALDGREPIKALELNPRPVQPGPVHLAVASEDVVVIPEKPDAK